MVEVFETRAPLGVGSAMEYGKEIATKGAGVAVGLYVGNKAGSYIEGELAKPVTADSTTTDKVIAGLANNAPKGLLAIGAAKYLIKPGETGLMQDLAVGGVFGLAGDIVVDVISRFRNKGVPMAVLGDAILGGDSKVQSLLAENAELKAALEKSASTGIPLVRVDGVTVPYGVPKMPATAAAAIKDVIEKKYQAAAMQNTYLNEAPVSTEQKYAFAGKDIASPEVLVQAFGFVRGD